MNFLDNKEVLTPAQKSNLILRTVTSFVSLFCSSFICIFYLLYHKLNKNFGLLLIFCVAFTDFFLSCLTFFPSLNCIISNKNFFGTDKNWCILLGLLWELFQNINYTFAFAITLTLYLNYCRKTKYSQQKRIIFYFIITFLLISVILALIPYFGKAYGPMDVVETDCWIPNDTYKLVFYIPLWVCEISITILVILIYIAMKKSTNEEENMSKRFIYFPLAFIICWFFDIILYFTNYKFLEYVTVFMYPLQGCINACIFGLINHFIKDKIVNFFKCKCFKRKINLKTGELTAEEIRRKRSEEQNEKNIFLLREDY